MAWYDKNDVLVYVPHIGEYYGDKTVSRPIWITPSFTWMMHHADWLNSPDYEVIECMMIQRFVFDELLFEAFPADFPNNQYESQDEWKEQKAQATVLYQWQDDYSPDGLPLKRKTLLLGVHSRTWMQFVIKSQIVSFNDIDESLFKQKEQAIAPFDLLKIPDEQIYPVDPTIRQQLEMDG